LSPGLVDFGRRHDPRELELWRPPLDTTMNGTQSGGRRGPSLLAEAMREQRALPTPSGSDGAPRAFCGIGVCMECETEIDGRIVRACLVEGSA
jgi:aerobic-type carbon monoxide dehydrogenase small subunit (CoxS/CutS family)